MAMAKERKRAPARSPAWTSLELVATQVLRAAETDSKVDLLTALLPILDSVSE